MSFIDNLRNAAADLIEYGLNVEAGKKKKNIDPEVSEKDIEKWREESTKRRRDDFFGYDTSPAAYLRKKEYDRYDYDTNKSGNFYNDLKSMLSGEGFGKLEDSNNTIVPMEFYLPNSYKNLRGNGFEAPDYGHDDEFFGPKSREIFGNKDIVYIVGRTNPDENGNDTDTLFVNGKDFDDTNLKDFFSFSGSPDFDDMSSITGLYFSDGTFLDRDQALDFLAYNGDSLMNSNLIKRHGAKDSDISQYVIGNEAYADSLKKYLLESAGNTRKARVAYENALERLKNGEVSELDVMDQLRKGPYGTSWTWNPENNMWERSEGNPYEYLIELPYSESAE